MGVKSLWTLLSPIGRPVMLETVEGKVMAIDSSIWLYQFQATMRDKEGRSLVNAHVLGFLRRISKLLFYGIKPVFVFDGGAPTLKRNTLSERKKKKLGAATTHVKLAEKLLAAQMRREALNHRSKGKNKQANDVLLSEDTVYLEDIDGSVPKTPPKRKLPTPSSSSTKARKIRDHDPYNLPQVDMDEVITKTTRSSAPDPRLATEDELRTFIEQMRPEDFDVNSPDFRELPTEVQYEIIGDLRLKSRQTSYARLQRMLKNAPTPLDFSKQQINNLRQRNALTQQLLMTTDSIGTANIAIPVRIASERNREYILMKNEGVDGGWILGIKDTGTREKPIVLDHEDYASEREDSDDDMEEVQVPTFNEDLVHRPGDVISPGARAAQKDVMSPISRSTDRRSIFATRRKDLDIHSGNDLLIDDSEDDDMLAYAIQQSLDQPQVRQHDTQSKGSSSNGPERVQETSRSPQDIANDEYSAHSRLETALSIANTGPSRPPSSPFGPSKSRTSFGPPTILLSTQKLPPLLNEDYNGQTEVIETVSVLPTEQAEVLPSSDRSAIPLGGEAPEPSIADIFDAEQGSSIFGQPSLLTSISTPISISNQRKTPAASFDGTFDQPQLPLRLQANTPSVVSQVEDVSPKDDQMLVSFSNSESDDDMEEVVVAVPTSTVSHIPTDNTDSPPQSSHGRDVRPGTPEETRDVLMQSHPIDNDEVLLSSTASAPIHEAEARPLSPHLSEDDWDPAKEMDAHQEEGEFARFMSQVKGRNMDEVRQEIDAEINSLNQQKKNAMRDSDDITQQMIAQIMTMLRLFGIPYITAPMEAEAQCAELVSLELVDGVITDDSDVFLFGAQRVYKNMFNQSKTVECFLFSDLSRELGLDRDALIHLAYLLGSDYTEGLPGVGPVVAMELLEEFPGLNGLHRFKDWWVKVQSGKDRPEDSQSKFRKQFKKKFKNLYLPDDWPNSVVRDAYYHPTVDSSEEPFKWGMPDLDGLRSFLHQELGWQKTKVDELLLPIIQRMNKRNQAAALNKQGNLNDFLDISAGSGTHAPRQSQAYQSKRLQQVISDFRKRRKNASAPESRSRSLSEEAGNNEGSSTHPPPVKRRKTNNTGNKKAKGKATTPEGGTTKGNGIRSQGRGERSLEDRPSEPGSAEISDNDNDDDFIPPHGYEPTELEADLRPKLRPQKIATRSRSKIKGQHGEADDSS